MFLRVHFHSQLLTIKCRVLALNIFNFQLIFGFIYFVTCQLNSFLSAIFLSTVKLSTANSNRSTIF